MVTDAERAELEIANGFRQFELAIDVIRFYLEPERPFSLRPSLILQLQECAVEGIEFDAGTWRQVPIGISKSRHLPPPAHLVTGLVDEMCGYVNDNWHERSAFHLSAYIMWRLNWIHPFRDGNGRTSRILSYLALCLRLGYVLPGSPTIPQQIQDNRKPYFDALESADDIMAKGRIDLSVMESMIKGMLATQLLSVIHSAENGKV